MKVEVVGEIVRGQREWEDREWFPPGPQLAICLSGGKERLTDLTDDELLQVASAARRQTSWAQARELAAIAELSQRRSDAENDGDPDYRVLPAHESVTEEIAAALTITGNAAATLVHLAERLTGPLAATGKALETGQIDMGKARVICDAADNMPDEVAERLETAALEKASGQTTGQLRRRIKRIVHRLAPAAAEERKREAVRQRRLEVWDTPSGTTDLALCDLAPEDAHAIYNKISAAAHGLKQDGDARALPQIRADLATLLLHGTKLPAAVRTLPADDAAPTTPRSPEKAGLRPDEHGLHLVSGAEPSNPRLRDTSAPSLARRDALLAASAAPRSVRPPAAAPLQPAGPAPSGARLLDAGGRCSAGRGVLLVTGSAPRSARPPDAAGLRPGGRGVHPPDAGGLRPVGHGVRLVFGAAPDGARRLDAAALRPDGRGLHLVAGAAVSAARLLDAGGRCSAGRGVLLVAGTVPKSVRRLDAAGLRPDGRGLHLVAGAVVSGVRLSGAGGACPSGGGVLLVGGGAVEAGVLDVGRGGEDAVGRALAGMVGRRLAHVRERVSPRELPVAIARAVQRIHDQLADARDAVCQGGDETHGRPGYRPTNALRRHVVGRHATCVFPSCNRDAHRCDLDHTIPWKPGTTCRCNLAPLCRRHHRLKQTPGWRLHQIWPGLMVWTTPSGGWYIVRPDREGAVAPS